MGRINLELPESFLYSTDLAVRITDINYGNHLGNDALLSLIHEARFRFFRHYGFSELDVAGAGIIMTDSVIVYKSQGFYGDVLRFDVTAGDFTRKGCDLFYRIAQKDSGKEVARAKTGIVFFDYAKQKVARVPEPFRSIFA